MILYRAKNRINDKCYVGITSSSLARRRSEHDAAARNGSDYPFHRALRVYGSHLFTWEVLARTDDRNELLEMERSAILQNNSYGSSGYNATFGGEGRYGVPHSEKTKRKLSEAARRQFSEKGHPRAGAAMPDHVRQKLREANERMRAEGKHPRKGTRHDEATRAKLRDAWVRRKARKDHADAPHNQEG